MLIVLSSGFFSFTTSDLLLSVFSILPEYLSELYGIIMTVEPRFVGVLRHEKILWKTESGSLSDLDRVDSQKVLPNKQTNKQSLTGLALCVVRRTDTTAMNSKKVWPHHGRQHGKGGKVASAEYDKPDKEDNFKTDSFSLLFSSKEQEQEYLDDMW